MSGMERNFYEILNATSTASFEELKSNYKQLILQCHPDKLLQQQKQQHVSFDNNSDKLEIDDPNNAEFVAITEAWNCLKDPNKRKQYDAELLLNKFHTHNNIYAHIKLSEMKKQINTGEYYTEEEESTEDTVEDDCNTPKYLYTYECRCGGQYIVDESAEQYCRIGNHGTKIKNNDNHYNDYNKSVDDDDDAGNQSQNKSSPTEIQYKNSVDVAASSGSGGGGAGGGTEGVIFNEHNSIGDDEEGGELIVECTECSLVIILNG